MKIRRCPCCAQLVHFEPERALLRCWSCGALCDFSQPGVLARTLRAAMARLPELPLCSRASGVARLALAGAVPIATLMLLGCNSLDVRIVLDPLAPFLIP